MKYPSIPLKDTVVFPGSIATLLVGRDASIQAVEMAKQDKDKHLVLVSQRDSSLESPQLDDLYNHAVIVRLVKVQPLPDESVKILVEGLSKVALVAFDDDKVYQATIQAIEETALSSSDELLWLRLFREKLDSYASLADSVSEEQKMLWASCKQLDTLLDLLASHLPLTFEAKQNLLDTQGVVSRAELLLQSLQREHEWLAMQQHVDDLVRKDLQSDQFKAFKEARLRALRALLGEDEEQEQGDGQHHLAELAERLKSLPLPEKSKAHVFGEFKKLQRMPPFSAEATLTHDYLDWITALPWGKYTKLCQSLHESSSVLNARHAGLEKVKTRVLEHLAVSMHKQTQTGPILCLVGPPGVGKTSFASAIAEAMGCEFARIALGGVRDEAEIRGHRKTYIGAMPGRIIRALKQVKQANPVILLDEIDKMGMDHRGDPASALLEVLDNQQNEHFVDHFIEIPFDLSQVTFIVTANSLNIPPALKDRLEIIHLSGYTELEKINIAQSHLIPKQLEEVGLAPGALKLSSTLLQTIIQHYTREAGVRGLYRCLGTIARKLVTEHVKTGKAIRRTITNHQLANGPCWLGAPLYQSPHHPLKQPIGRVSGLAWTEAGGDVLTIEASVFPGKGRLETTGSLGDVMQESMRMVRAFLRTKTTYLGVDADYFQKHDMHLHAPEGAVPKDGPSAGIAICVALVSAMTRQAVRQTIAMTGEMTLHGQVLAIGGVKEKILAAKRYAIKTVFLPLENEVQVKALSKDVVDGLTIQYVTKVEDVLTQAFETRMECADASVE